MYKLEKETVIRYLLIATAVLVTLAAFVLFFDLALPQLGIVVRFIGMLISPFAVAWLVAVITRPLNQAMVKKLHIPRSLTVLIIMLLLLGFLTAMIVLVISVLSSVLSDLSYYVVNVEQYANEAVTFLMGLYDRLELDFSHFEQYFDKLQSQIGSWAGQGLDAVFSVVKATPGAILLLFVCLVAVFYWCRDEFKVRDVLINAFPVKKRDKIRGAYDNISEVIGGYVRAQALLVTISITICIIGFMVIRAKSPFAMGLFAGVMDIIPILGPGTLIVPWAIWSMATGRFGFGVGLLIIYLTVSITRYILEPKVVGDRVGLHPLAALAAIFVGMRMFGLVGLILGPIVLAVIMAVVRNRRQSNIINPRQHKDKKPEGNGEEKPKLIIK